MLDKDGYRPNVGIILVNKDNLVFWGKRSKENAWQFPQGGIHNNESPEQALYRELYEELGISHELVEMLGCTKDWLFYDVPSAYNRSGVKYKGQKQIWFLLKFIGKDMDINVRYHKYQEFDDWHWVEYWSTKDKVINFKRNVYEKALLELSNYLPKYET